MKSTVALCAKAMKKELQLAFPGKKFSVKSESFSMGNAVNAYLVGTKEEYLEIREKAWDIVSKYQYGSFDGMTDSYDCTNVRNDIPQTKWATFSYTS